MHLREPASRWERLSRPMCGKALPFRMSNLFSRRLCLPVCRLRRSLGERLTLVGKPQAFRTSSGIAVRRFDV